MVLSRGSGGGPVVGECEGDYIYEPRKHCLLWQPSVIDSSNKTGSMEFSVPMGTSSQFFPVQVSFHTNQSYARLAVSLIFAKLLTQRIM